MSDILVDQIKTRLSAVYDPFLDNDYITSGVVSSVQTNNDSLDIELVLPYPVGGLEQAIEKTVRQVLLDLPIKKLQVMIKSKIRRHRAYPSGKTIGEISNIIAVSSGKGGVGKTTVSVLLARALSSCGAQVGILDADIHGPNVASMLGAQVASSTGGAEIKPMMVDGLATQSMAYWTNVDDPIIWRGPMASRALQDLLYKSAWPKLDYLIVDMPPGTSDIALTMAKVVPVSAYVLVSTSQTAAILDVMRSYHMLDKLSLPVLGFVENMSSQRCVECGHEMPVFSGSGVAELAQRFDRPVLATLPFEPQWQLLGDKGNDGLSFDANNEKIFGRALEMARHITGRLAQQPLDYQSCFGKIHVEHRNKE